MDHEKLRRFLSQVAPEPGRVESYAERTASLEGGLETAVPGAGEQAPDVVMAALEKVEQGAPLTDEQASALEAIVLPRERPVIDIVAGTFANPGAPFEHLGHDATRAVITGVIPAVGRLELPDHPSLPFGGTAFVVGPGLLMTNRHVAELFASGLGRDGLVFLAGAQAGVDFRQELGHTEKRYVAVQRIRMIHPYWDMALLGVDGLSPSTPTLRLSTTDPDDLAGRDVVVIGYPALDPRNNIALQNAIFRSVFNVKRLQPGKVNAQAGIMSFGNNVLAMTHDCSTLGGNSGSAVVDVTTGAILGLHFAGRYLEANYSVPARSLALDRRVVDAGVTFDGEVSPPAAVEWDHAWARADPGPGPVAAHRDEDVAGGKDSTSASLATPVTAAGSAVTLHVPLEITVRIDGGVGSTPISATPATEAMVEPFHDEDLDKRAGYDDVFLGRRLPLPTLDPGAPVSRLDDGSTELRYEHFSATMNRKRRLAHFVAANVDGRPDHAQPEPDRDYTRKGLTGLSDNDQEKWFVDPRIPAMHQLPDRFFNRDRTSFDKGHIIRRTYVGWGDTYDEVRRANGDTYHVTNCSPQIAAFNRSNKRGIWGQLENLVQEQAKAETYSVIAGPVFLDNDPEFEGIDDRGKTTVQIPRTFWKVIVANSVDGLKAFAFKLDQDLSGVDMTELAFDAAWRERMISAADLEAAIGSLRFPDILHDADQAGTVDGESVRRGAGVELVVSGSG